jgi:acetylornithine deacetylase/succinyl-diaminopimelate desuccinylase-like protein
VDILELTKKLMSFKSISNEKEISSKCIDYILDYVGDDKNIFIKPINSNGFRSVLLSNADTLELNVLEVGHVDVVPVSSDKIFEPRIEGDLLYGRGGGDMKGFIAVGLEVLKFVVKSNLKMKYGLLIVTDEEISSENGSKYWAETLGLKAKLVLDPDSGKKLNTIIYKSKGAFFFKLISNGESVHGSQPWSSSADAVENLIQSINNLRKIFPHYSKKNEPDDKWVDTMHVGIIDGGKAVNAVADYAEAKIDIRFTEKYTAESLKELIKTNIVDGVEAIFEVVGKVVFNDKNNRYLKLYAEVLEKYAKEKINFEFASSGSDSRYFSNNNTTIIANQADCGEIHADGEWLNIKKLSDFFEVRKEFLEKIDEENF